VDNTQWDVYVRMEYTNGDLEKKPTNLKALSKNGSPPPQSTQDLAFEDGHFRGIFELRSISCEQRLDVWSTAFYTAWERHPMKLEYQNRKLKVVRQLIHLA
jgi:hypothetical protein